MNEEKREILEHLVKYLQDKINTGYHKIFYNDDMYDEKTIDCINAINDTLEENKRLNNIIDELESNLYKEWLEWKDSDCESIYVRAFEDKAIYDYLQELKGSNNNE